MVSFLTPNFLQRSQQIVQSNYERNFNNPSLPFLTAIDISEYIHNSSGIQQTHFRAYLLSEVLLQ